ncbi:response regulator transcription factor [Nocardioides sp. J54]|uniref:response regulator transcription factor n=1 Tax=Nocardioides sp. J54 TaxID=935866 RepID=UPI0004B4CF39|nr:response regulator transcription factor [Nocardioides sp. J54]
MDVVGQAGDAPGLPALVEADPPDAVVDLRMPPGFGTEGIDVAVRIREALPQVAVMLLSQYVEAHHALRLMTEFDGRVGYLLKDRVSDPAVFAGDLRRITAGEVVIDAELVTRLLTRRRERDPLEALTARERSALGLMAQGLSNVAIADELCLSPKTVEAHVSSIFTKLDLPPSERDNRRVLAVLRFLRQQ